MKKLINSIYPLYRTSGEEGFYSEDHTFDHKKTIAAALKRGYKLTEEDMEKYTEGNAICVKGGGYRG